MKKDVDIDARAAQLRAKVEEFNGELKSFIEDTGCEVTVGEMGISYTVHKEGRGRIMVPGNKLTLSEIVKRY